jgi:hypothetical protein
MRRSAHIRTRAITDLRTGVRLSPSEIRLLEDTASYHGRVEGIDAATAQQDLLLVYAHCRALRQQQPLAFSLQQLLSLR